MRLKRKLILHPKQMEFLTNDLLFRLFVGGRFAGKTFSGAQAAIEEAGKRRCWGMCVAPTYKSLRDYVIRSFLEQAGGIVANYNKSLYEADLINGSKVLFRSADDPNSLRGPDLSWVWLDEARDMEVKVWKVCLPCLREGGRTGRLWITTTPDGKSGSWIHDRFVVRGNHNYAMFQASSAQNPYVSKELLAAIEEDYGFGSWGKQELGGEWVDPEGALFRRQDFKIIDTLPEDIQLVRSWDLALSTKETACFTVGMLEGFDGESNLYIADVIRGKWEWPDARELIIQTAILDGTDVTLLMEKVAFQAAAIQELQREERLLNHCIEESVPDRDKLTRALPVASRARSGKVFLVRGPWNAPLLDVLASFTGAAKDVADYVDAMSQGYHWLAENAGSMEIMRL